MAKFGVVLPDHMADAVDEPLEYGDSRSERIRELIRIGLAVEEALEEADMLQDVPEGTKRADFAKQAISEKVSGEGNERQPRTGSESESDENN